MCDAEAKTFPITDFGRPKGDPDNTYRGRNYRLCRAIDLTKLKMVTEEMIEAGAPARLVEHTCGAINKLLAILRGLNPKDPEPR